MRVSRETQGLAGGVVLSSPRLPPLRAALDLSRPRPRGLTTSPGWSEGRTSLKNRGEEGAGEGEWCGVASSRSEKQIRSETRNPVVLQVLPPG